MASPNSGLNVLFAFLLSVICAIRIGLNLLFAFLLSVYRYFAIGKDFTLKCFDKGRILENGTDNAFIQSLNLSSYDYGTELADLGITKRNCWQNCSAASDGINHEHFPRPEDPISLTEEAQDDPENSTINGNYEPAYNSGNRSKEIKKQERVTLKPRIIMIGVLMLLLLPNVCCHLEETPINVAVISGSGQVLFKCKSSEGYVLKWMMQKSTQSQRQVLYYDYITSRVAEPFCHVENEEPGKFYLTLTTKRKAAQTYICQEPGTNNEFSADLIILNETRLQKDFSEDHVIIKCIVEFRGNWPPELEWSYNGTWIDEGVSTTTVPNALVSSTLVLPLSAFDRNYTCTTKFDIRRKPKQTTSANVPDYVSNSVLTVEASKVISDEPGQSTVNGMSWSLMIIGLTFIVIIACVVGVTAGICLYKKCWQYRKVNKENPKPTCPCTVV